METIMNLIKSPFSWMQSQILTKWIGRVLLFAIITTSGWMANAGLSQEAVASWQSATTALVEPAALLIAAWLLALVRHKIALKTEVK